MRFALKKVLKGVISSIIILILAIQVSAEEGAPSAMEARYRQGGQVEGQTSLAEQYVFRLAKRSRARRMIVGGGCAAFGGLLLAETIPALSQEAESDWEELGKAFAVMGVAIGGCIVALGVNTFASPSQSERAVKQIQTIADRAQREKACEDALARLAKRGKKARMVWGGIFTACTLSSLEAGDISPAFFGAAALYFFLAKSPAETANRAYLEKRALKPSPTLVLGLAPRGGFRVGLSMEF